MASSTKSEKQLPYSYSSLQVETSHTHQTSTFDVWSMIRVLALILVFALFALLALILYICLVSATFDPQPVTMNPTSFSLSNFSVNWEADFTFGCQDCDADETEYYDIQVNINYNDKDDIAFSKVFIEPFQLGTNEQKKVHAKFGNDLGILKDGKKMDWKPLHMTMELKPMLSYKLMLMGPVWIPSGIVMDSHCWDLFLGVILDTGGGKLILSSPIECPQPKY
ncbi:hypothetical protein CCACVL1_30689 [Corchorus capsularis]|uniref:Uncharacterized protein n=1 Tax=Corchorus capsularis TaxID=210143 RepID=A0A1R3FVX8_COCAP|nr:hypothetical protein CCACVL1_30689 [Corchorus capsularis]